MNGKSTGLVAALSLCLAAFLFGVPAEKTVESLWTAAPVKIDGVAQEWEDATPIVDETSKVEYALKNDGQNLYIIMVFKGPLSKTTLDYTGMKIYFTTGTKKSKDFGILFQKKQYTAEALIASMEKKGQKLTEEQKAEIRKKPMHIIFTEEIIRPKKAPVLSDAAIVTEPPIFRQIDKGPLSVCEFRIPLSKINQLGGIGAEAGQQILLGFEWGGMTNQILRDMMAGRADMSVSAADRGVSAEGGWRDSSGEEGGEIRGMGGGVGDLRRNPRYKLHSFWITAKLASQGS